MDNRRTDSARDHDDSELIDHIEPTPPQGGRSGGGLQSNVATQATLERVRDPDAHEGVDKQDDIDHGQRRPAAKTPDGNRG